MKRIVLTLFGLFCFALSNAADLYVNGSGNANTYYTIQAAVNAASSGDNIYVATVGTYSENVEVNNKSLFIVASVADEQFTLSGSFNLNPGAGNEVTIIGLYNGNISISNSSNGTVNLISSFVSSINSYSGNVKLNVYDCEITNEFLMANGSVKGSVLNHLNIYNSSSANKDTIRIMGNYMKSLDWNSSYAYFEICNNFINGKLSSSYSSYPLRIDNFQSTAGGTNLIANNTIDFSYLGSSSSFAGIRVSSSNSAQNVVIVNNYIKNNSQSYSYAIVFNNSNANALIANNFYYSGYFSYGLNNSTLTNNGSSSVNYSYNDSTGVLNGGMNSGLNQIEYRDTDNTVNDIGPAGGPHSWYNYNPSSGKAAIFNLEIPTQLYIGGNHNIKAKAFHKN